MKHTWLALLACSLWLGCSKGAAEGTTSPSTAKSSETGAAIAEPQATPWTWTASNAGGYWCAWRAPEGPVAMGPSFPIEIRLAKSENGPPLDLPAQALAVDARMP
ncbi:MAG TPA: hypothetical protein PLJ12_08815, partial [Planctomycetota bacterium]|nr:hypothetical protein [Planctomycetota bacterium]